MDSTSNKSDSTKQDQKNVTVVRYFVVSSGRRKRCEKKKCRVRTYEKKKKERGAIHERTGRSPSSVLKPSLSLSDDSILIVAKAGLFGRILKLMLVP